MTASESVKHRAAWTLAKASESANFGILLVTTWVLALIRPFIVIRLATFRTERIGHFIADTDLAIALLNQHRSQDGFQRKYVFVMPDAVCNEQLREMYARSLRQSPDVRVLDCRESWLARRLLNPTRHLTQAAQQRGKFSSYYCGSPDASGIDACGYRPNSRPHLVFSEDEAERGWRELSSLGIFPTDRLICIHIRDAAYLQVTLPERDWSYHDYRNPDPNSYVPAIRFLLDRGYKVIRMGKVTNAKLPIEEATFIDYAKWEGRSDFLDLFLYAQAEMAIAGSASGIDQIAFTFNIPAVTTNFIPFEDPRMAISKAMVIPCLLRSTVTGETVPLSTMMQYRFGSSTRFQEAGLEPVYNTAEEIIEVVHEAVDRLLPEGSGSNPESKLEIQFWNWAEQQGISERVTAGPWTTDFCRARIGTAFLRRHSRILLA